MTKSQLLRLLEETLVMKPLSLTGDEILCDLEAWDSLSTLLFIAMADKKFGLILRGNQVTRCQTVDELISLLDGARLAA